MTDDIRGKREGAHCRGRDQERCDQCDGERVGTAEKPVDRLRSFPAPLLLGEVRDKKSVELLIERRRRLAALRPNA